MEPDWAAEHLQTIRTLMERSALYRRALAPIFTFVGAVGIVAAVVGWWLKIESVSAFAIYWMAVCLVAIGGALMLVRKQALKHGEKFWSPPTRRIAQAILPALLIGLVLGVVLTVTVGFDVIVAEHYNGADSALCLFMILVWTLLYGLALHAASFFIPRGVRLFAWAFIIAGLVLLVLLPFNLVPDSYISPHWIMGILFGVSHLACGIYLYFTEQRKNEA
jgi:hypothetical protein